MSAAIQLEDGAPGEAVRLDGEVLEVVLPRPLAPGTPARMKLDAAGAAVPVEGKTIGSKRRDDGRYHVKLRLVNLRRAHRAALESVLSRPTDDGG